jgi:hypothetical protein
MKRFLQTLALFLLSLPLAWALLYLMAGRSERALDQFIGDQTHWGAVHQRTSEWHDDPGLRDRCDVLFFGSSTCYSGIDPRALEAYGMQGFNFCSSSQALGNSAVLLTAALAESRPEWVVLDVYPDLWGQPYNVECSRDWALNARMHNVRWGWTGLRHAAAVRDPFNGVVTALQWVNERLPAWLQHGHDAPQDAWGRYAGRGFVARTFPALTAAPDCPEEAQAVFTPDLCALLAQVQARCAAQGARLALVVPPELCPAAFTPPACWDGLTVIRGADWPGSTDPSFYYDDHHLTEAGAAAYSAWLAGELVGGR